MAAIGTYTAPERDRDSRIGIDGIGEIDYHDRQ